jgi:hypothetical protein
MASLIFDIASDGIAKQTIDWDGGADLRVLLIKGAGTPIKGNATVLAALAEANVDECDATDYVRKTLANPTVSTTGNKTLFDADNPVWTTLGGASNNTITGALIYKGTTASGDDGTNIPICYLDTNDLATNGGQVTLTKDATNKWFYLNNT